MKTDNVVAFVLAGGQGKRLYPLTAEHAKPALPFIGGCRIIDFVLSNLANSGVRSIYVIAQHQPASLVRHLRAAWMRSASGRRLEVLLPPAGSSGFRGTADAVYQCLRVLEQHTPELISVFAADHIYRMDLRQMVAFHREVAADVSVSALPVALADASRFGIMATDRNQRITAFQEKPVQPRTIPGDPTRAYASMGNYLFNPRVLIQALVKGQHRGAIDFGHDIFPELIPWRRVFAYDFRTNIVPGEQPYEEAAYWRDVGTIEALHAARHDTEGTRPRFDLANRAWPIAAHSADLDTPRLAAGQAAPAPATRSARGWRWQQ